MATTLQQQDTEYRPTHWESVDCLFCHEKSFSVVEKFGPEKRYTYVRCSKCHLTYLNPRPRYDQAFVETAYSVYATSVGEVWTGTELTSEGRERSAIHTGVLNRIEKLLGHKGTLLEIGSHLGFFSYIAQSLGWTVTGVDISEAMVEIARREFKVNALAGDWLKLPLPLAHFDALYCSHTIEHIPNPADWVDGFRRHIKPSGIVCIEVPNAEGISAKFKRLLKRLHLKKDRWAKWRTPDHLYEPCERSLVPFLESRGFQILKVMTYARDKAAPGLLSEFYHEKLRWGSNLRIIMRLK
jgi:2-polyprenyl-3-methyl-5-hydroxy-6-metoxy-1,4-benzoquinol methylase